jgi:hypothetical protein
MMTTTTMAQLQRARRRTERAFGPDGRLLDALHAWVDYSRAASTISGNQAGVRYADQWSEQLTHAARFGMRGTMRMWFQRYLDKNIETLQVHRDGGVWAPGTRLVTQVRPTFALIGNSRRVYRDGTVITQTAHTLVIATENAVCAYRSTGA